LLGNCGWARA